MHALSSKKAETMDTSNNARSSDAVGELVCNIDVHRQDFTAHYAWLANTEPTRFAAMVEAVTQGNVALSAAILRSWGIRWKDGEAALSRDPLWDATLPEWTDQARLAGQSNTARMLSFLCDDPRPMGALYEGGNGPIPLGFSGLSLLWDGDEGEFCLCCGICGEKTYVEDGPDFAGPSP